MNKEILRLAIPNILSNISVPLLSTVDTALMGHLSTLHLGAVGVGSMIFNFVYWNFGFLRMGTTGMTAQAFGKNDKSEMMLTISRAMMVALLLATIVILFQNLIGQGSFYLMNISDEQTTLVAEYFYIRIWAAPATLGLFAMIGWFFGMQNAIYPLVLTIVINVVNILLSFLLVKQYNMGVAGVAWGTVVAQYVGLALALILFWKKYRQHLQHYTRKATLEIEALSKFLLINRDIFIRTFCLTFAFGFFYSRSANAGEVILAVNVILLQFLNWMSYGIDGFAYASESLVGKYKGANNLGRLRQSIRLSFVWGMVLALIFSFAYLVFGENLLRIFTDQENLIVASTPYLFWMFLFPLISTPCYIWDGIYIGLTASHAMRQTMLAALVIYLIAYFILFPMFQNHGLWAALLLFMAARGIIQWVWYRKRIMYFE